MSKFLPKFLIAIVTLTGCMSVANAQQSEPIKCEVKTADSTVGLQYGQLEGDAYFLSFVILENAQNQLIITPIKSAEEMGAFVYELIQLGAIQRDRMLQSIKPVMPEIAKNWYKDQLVKKVAAEVLEGILSAYVFKRNGDELSFRVLDSFKHNSFDRDGSLARLQTSLSKAEKLTLTVPYLSQEKIWKKTQLSMDCVK